MVSQQDYSTLGWVKKELDETFKQAANALQTYVEDDADVAQLRFCHTYMHQVYGTLRMVELEGAAQLALEVENVLDALINESIDNTEDAFDVVTRAILQLPSYLDHLLAGGRESPVLLIPIMNELRGQYGEKPLSPSAMFTPDLSIMPPLSDKGGKDCSEIAKKFVKSYQTGLVAWLKKPTDKKSLQMMQRVIALLQKSATQPEAGRLWWVADGLFEAIINGGIEVDASVKKQVSQLERQINQLVEKGEEEYNHSVPEDLLKGMLYNIACAQPKGQSVVGLKAAFSLSDYLPDESALESAQIDLTAPSAELLKTVSSAIKEDMARVRDVLDIYDSNSSRQVDDLEPSVGLLRKIADTLSMVGMRVSGKLVRSQVDVVTGMLERGEEPEDKQLLGVASAMLYVETTLDNLISGRATSEDEGEVIPAELGDVPENKYRQVLGVVLQEAITSIGRVKESLDGFVRGDYAYEKLNEIPEICDQVQGGMYMVAQDHAADLLKRVSVYVRYALIKERQRPDAAVLDHLADAITSIEYYLEGVNENRPLTEAILNVAERSLKEIGYKPPVIEGVPADGNAHTEVLNAGEIADVLTAVEAAEASPVAPEATPVDDVAALHFEIDEASQPSEESTSVVDEISEPDIDGSILDVPSELVEEIEPVTELADAPLDAGLLPDEITVEPQLPEELVPVVEATSESVVDELTEDVASELPAEADSPLELEFDASAFEDEETQAINLSQFEEMMPAAESKESIEPIAVSEDSVEAADFAFDLDSEIPEFAIEEPESGVEESAAVPEVAADVDSIPIEEEVEPEIAAAKVAAEPLPDFPMLAADFDAEALEIFLEEAEDEVAAIKENRPKWAANLAEEEVLLDLRRSFHTLKGSGRLVGALLIAEFSGTFEAMLNHVMDDGLEVTAGIASLVADAEPVLDQLVAQLKGGEEPTAPVADIMAQAARLGPAEESMLAPFLYASQDETASADIVLPDEVQAETVSQISAPSELIAGTPILSDDYDPETLSIFLEEAEEVLETLQTQVPAWVANTHNEEALAEIRRAFHTLKGSGRLVGAQLMGEFSWSIEEMLNHVIEDKLESSPAVTGVVEQAVAVLPLLIEQLQGGVVTDIPLADLMAQAQTLSHGGTVADIQSQESIASEFIAPVVPTEQVEEGEAAESEELIEVTVEEPTESEASDVAEAEADLSEAMDPVLHEIYSQESLGHLETIEGFIAACKFQVEPFPVTDELIRALHTLHGSSNMAGVANIADVTGYLERYAKDLAEHGIGFSQDAVDALSELDAYINATLKFLANPDGKLPDGEQLLAHIERLQDQLTAMPTMIVDAEKVSEILRSVEQKSVEVLECYELGDVDDELLEIFLEEATDLLDSVDNTLQQWTESLEDMDVVAELQRVMHTLKGSARMATVIPMGDLCHAMETLLEHVADGRQAPELAMIDLLNRACDRMSDMLEKINSRKPIPLVKDILNEIAAYGAELPSMQLEGVESAALSADEIVLEEAEALPDEPEIELERVDPVAEVSPNPIADGEGFVLADIDEDLLDIFLEEGAELLDSFDNTLQQWEESLNDLTLVAELQRVMHTLKGSARMAAVTPMGDLCHVMESLMEKVAEGRQEPQEAMTDLLHRACDQMATMLEQIRANQAISMPTGLVDEIEAYATGAARSEVIQKDLPEDADQELTPKELARIDTFLKQGEEQFNASEITFQHWVHSPENTALVLELRRKLQKISKKARKAGLNDLADLGQLIESVLSRVVDGHISISKQLFDVMHIAMDRFGSAVEAVKEGLPQESIADIRTQVDTLLHRGGLHEEMREAPQPLEETLPPIAEEEHAEGLESEAASAKSDERRTASRVQHETVRVRSDLIDSLVNYAGEVSIYRARIEQQLSVFRFNIGEMDQIISRVHEHLRKLEIETEAQMLYRFEKETDLHKEDFDPLELDRFSTLQTLSRALMESVHDLLSVEDMLENLTSEAETLLLQQSRVTSDLQEGLMRSRMVEFSGLLPRLRRIVRQTSQELGKRTELKVVGADVELDSTVIDRVVPAIEHLLRNAVAHGIETPAQRSKRGKAEKGTIALTLARDGGDVIIRISDDGNGIDFDAVHSKAVAKGMIKADAKLSEQDMMQFILESGMSTADNVSQVAGRGVGMDVVVSETKQLGGSLGIESERGKGTTFIVRLPFTLAINRALLIYLGEEVFAVPLAMIEGIARMSADEVQDFYENDDKEYEYAGRKYTFYTLSSLLGRPNPDLPKGRRRMPVLLVRSGNQHAALLVDSIMGSREIVVKSVGPQLSTVRGLLGATMLGDGRVVLIVDVGALMRHGVISHIKTDQLVDGKLMAHQAEEDRKPTVMVVDDSITIRKVTTRLLERNNMNAVTAKDGVDALAVLENVNPDVMLLDIEMPRMDGYELAARIRSDSKLKDLPIIMITSRTGEKHRKRALDIGVNVYLGKPYQEEQLVSTITQLLEEANA